MVTLLHLSDIPRGSGVAHGRLNPETGLNTRLEDCMAALTRCIDRALAEPVDPWPSADRHPALADQVNPDHPARNRGGGADHRHEPWAVMPGASFVIRQIYTRIQQRLDS